MADHFSLDLLVIHRKADIEVGEHCLTPASSQVTYLTLTYFILLTSLSYYYLQYKNSYPFHSQYVPISWRLLFVYVLYAILIGC